MSLNCIGAISSRPQTAMTYPPGQPGKYLITKTSAATATPPLRMARTTTAARPARLIPPAYQRKPQQPHSAQVDLRLLNMGRLFTGQAVSTTPRARGQYWYSSNPGRQNNNSKTMRIVCGLCGDQSFNPLILFAQGLRHQHGSISASSDLQSDVRTSAHCYASNRQFPKGVQVQLGRPSA